MLFNPHEAHCLRVQAPGGAPPIQHSAGGIHLPGSAPPCAAGPGCGSGHAVPPLPPAAHHPQVRVGSQRVPQRCAAWSAPHCMAGSFMHAPLLLPSRDLKSPNLLVDAHYRVKVG